MKRLIFTIILMLISAVHAADKRPDIILIMTDDMGYSDLGCYGGEIKTPHLDSLAANGLRYRNFYSENMENKNTHFISSIFLNISFTSI